MQLTDEQKNIIRSVLKELDVNPFISMGGYAGTGKTTCVATIQEALKAKKRKFLVCAYTGKATNVLRNKGISASTIHSTIYKPIKILNNDTIEWVLKSNFELDACEGFIIDEASMVSEEIHKDLLTYNLPILYVGDHGQLEPIGGKFNLMLDPHFKLETVHRNAGEIAHFAEHLRSGLPSTSFKGSNKVQIVKESAIKEKHLAQVDQIICAFNKTRISINEKVREFKKINYTYVAIDEKIICLRNKKKEGLFNGMQGVVTKLNKNADKFNFVSQGVHFKNILYDPNQWGKEKSDFKFYQEENPFDYAYAITAHKSQGDEFDSVIVYEERCNEWDHKKWCYTAASRAKHSIVWVARSNYVPTYL
ncbi:MAG: ATP-dependent RecD-like DNA helicase [Chryseobacterium sp.]